MNRKQSALPSSLPVSEKNKLSLQCTYHIQESNAIVRFIGSYLHFHICMFAYSNLVHENVPDLISKMVNSIGFIHVL